MYGAAPRDSACFTIRYAIDVPSVFPRKTTVFEASIAHHLHELDFSRATIAQREFSLVCGWMSFAR